MVHFVKKYVLLSMVTVLLLSLIACGGRDGSPNSNLAPDVEITSFEGHSSMSDAEEGNALLFQQTIRWNAKDEDGVIDGVAFRVKDAQGNYIKVPGYEVIDENDGWIYHYKPGANEEYALDDPDHVDQRTIWSDQAYAVINFPANNGQYTDIYGNTYGDSAVVISTFEIKCRDNYGVESLIKSKHFKCYSKPYEISISSTRGDVHEKTIGLGTIFTFNLLGSIPFIDDVPYYYEYQLRKQDLLTEDISGDSTWYNTKHLDNVSQVMITSQYLDGEDPALRPLLIFDKEIGSGVHETSSVLIARAIDQSGMFSEPDTVIFDVYRGYTPGTVAYDTMIWGLGEHHFTTYQPSNINETMPSTVNQYGEVQIATALFLNKDGVYTALYDESMKIWLRWGYLGEFEGNEPTAKAQNKVLDDVNGNNYFSEIKYFDIRFDGEYLNYAPLVEAGNVFSDEDGTRWLRVDKDHDIAQSYVLSNLTSGEHLLEIRSVDLQEVPDATPARFLFNLVEPVYSEQKDGILIIDDEQSTPFSPGDVIDSLYYYYCDSLTTNFDVIHIEELDDNLLHSGNDLMSPTDLQNYKLIIYHVDNPTAFSRFTEEYEVLNMYLRTGGNVLLSAGSTFYTIDSAMKQSQYPLFQDYFGLSMTDDDVIKKFERDGLSIDYQVLPYFVGSNTVSEFDVNLDLVIENSMNPMISRNGGLSRVSFFDESRLGNNTEVIYTTRLREPGDSSSDPSEYEHYLFNNKPIGTRTYRTNYDLEGKELKSTCFAFGFPLSYMEPEQVKSLITQIYNSLD